jgi:RNA polymerase sigma-70 factor (ECF subfamily)
MMETVTTDEIFEAQRSHLFGVAYRMLGSRAEAEDVLQEAFLRWQAAPRDDVRNAQAMLTTIVTRLCLDQLKSAHARRVDYVGPWLPEPVRTHEPVDVESISLAFLVILENLSPVERAVYLLTEVFAYSHAEVAQIVGKDDVACRQILRRARDHVAARRPRFAPSRERHEQLLRQFAVACNAGDLAGLERLLAEDATAWSDGGGKAFAARKVVRGAAMVARMYIGLTTKRPAAMTSEVVEINGWPALALYHEGALVSVVTIETDGDRIHAIRAIVNPDKLAGL